MSSLFSSLSKMGQKLHSQFNHTVEQTANKITEKANTLSGAEAKASKPVEKDDLEHHGDASQSKEVVDGATKDKAGLEAAKRKQAQMKAKQEGASAGEGEGKTGDLEKMSKTSKPGQWMKYAMVGAAVAPFVAMAGEGIAKSASNNGDSNKDKTPSGNTNPNGQ